MIPGFAIGNKLHDKNGNSAEQQDVDKAALVQEEFQDHPDNEEYCANCPHFEFPLIILRSRTHARATRTFVWEYRRDCRSAGNKKAHRR